MNIKVRVYEDRMGNIIAHAVNKKIRDEFPQGLFLQEGFLDNMVFKEYYVPVRFRRDLYNGWTVTFLMDYKLFEAYYKE